MAVANETEMKVLNFKIHLFFLSERIYLSFNSFCENVKHPTLLYEFQKFDCFNGEVQGALFLKESVCLAQKLFEPFDKIELRILLLKHSS